MGSGEGRRRGRDRMYMRRAREVHVCRTANCSRASSCEMNFVGVGSGFYRLAELIPDLHLVFNAWRTAFHSIED